MLLCYIEITRKSDENPLKNDRIKTINKIIIKKVKLKNKYNLRLRKFFYGVF